MMEGSSGSITGGGATGSTGVGSTTGTTGGMTGGSSGSDDCGCKWLYRGEHVWIIWGCT